MRILVLISPLHAGAELALNKLVKRRDFEIVGVARTSLAFTSRHLWHYARYTTRRTGVYYAVMFLLFINVHVIAAAIGSLMFWVVRKKRWFTIDALIEKYKIPLHQTSDINDAASHEFIRSCAPDIMVSLYFDQILKKETISIPPQGTINMHPGLLPHYRGLWAHFWNIFNGEKKGGVTIHHMDETLDTGDIIVQESFSIKKTDTKWRLRLRAARHGTRMLIDVLKKIKAGIKLPRIKPVGIGKYYTTPDKEQLKAFFARGKKLFSIQDFWRSMKNML
ncbi:MAG: formyltransferase family protein [Patescibacteria group bacterium]